MTVSSPDLRDREFIFIGGLHRSGTSVLSRLLREHPDVSGFSGTGVPEDEGQHLQTVFPPAKAHGGPGRFAFDVASHLCEASPLVTTENRLLLSAQWATHYDLGKRFLLEKSPPNLIRARFLQALFPRSRFVFIVRHPLAVALATQKWSKTSLVELLLHWHMAHAVLRNDLIHLKRFMIVRYEDVVADQQKAIGDICRFAGLASFMPREKVADHNHSYFEGLAQEPALYERLQTACPQVLTLAAEAGYALRVPYVLALNERPAFDVSPPLAG
jgi:hypothetical protein